MTGQFWTPGAPREAYDPDPAVEPGPARDTGGWRLAADVLADRILAGLRHAYAQAGVALPARQYPAPGAPRQVAWDCEQLTVTPAGIGWGPATNVGTEAAFQVGSSAGSRAVRHLILEVALVRKMPPGTSLEEDDSTTMTTLPDLDALAAAGRQHLVDMGVMSLAVVTMFGPEQLSGTIIPAGTHAAPGVVETAGPEGGYYATVTTVTVTLGDRA